MFKGKIVIFGGWSFKPNTEVNNFLLEAKIHIGIKEPAAFVGTV